MSEYSEIEEAKNQDIELEGLIDAIYQKYGFDYRGYARASLRRRALHRMGLSELDSISQLQHRVLRDRSFLELLLSDFSITTTEMFRDPAFFAAMSSEVVPILKTYPSIKIWHPGCSTGEEVYSMAILLKEEGLYDRSFLYATDVNPRALQKAKEGVFATDLIPSYTTNYHRSGGHLPFSTYYTAHHGAARMDVSLKENIAFSEHNLATDTVFSEVHLVVCRNVLIYFGRALQDRAIGLFHDSLIHRGILCLGVKESLILSSYGDRFEPLVETMRVYRKR